MDGTGRETRWKFHLGPRESTEFVSLLCRRRSASWLRSCSGASSGALRLCLACSLPTMASASQAIIASSFLTASLRPPPGVAGGSTEPPFWCLTPGAVRSRAGLQGTTTSVTALHARLHRHATAMRAYLLPPADPILPAGPFFAFHRAAGPEAMGMLSGCPSLFKEFHSESDRANRTCGFLHTTN
jgi:hypothetical protein